MVKVRHFLVAALGALLCAVPLAAQTPTGTITGRVLDRSSQRPLPGVSVGVEGTDLVTVTGADGRFIITSAPAGLRRLTASSIGYAALQQDVTVIAGESANVEFLLETEALALDALIVTGYGTQRRLAITGSVATVDADAANVGVISSANDMIQGRVAGVHTTVNNGEPGAGVQVRIRGGTSISASNEPLYVIDGMPIDNVPTEPRGIGIDSDPPLARNPLALLNPSDIESITILKDAAATAIYGSRAANGVVLIQTKQGSPGAVSIEYDGYIASSTAANSLELMTGAEYRQFVQDLVNAGETRLATRLANMGSADTDWEDELLHTGLTHSHNLSFAGGSQSTRYRASLNYMDQEGVVISNGFERIQGRLNAAHDAFGGRLRLGLNLSSSHMINDYLPYENTGGFEGGVFTNMVIYDPTRPVRFTDPATGEEVFYEQFCTSAGCTPQRLEQRNPVALAEQVADEGKTTRTLGNVTAAFDLFQGLTAQVNLGADRSNGIRRTYLPRSSPVGAQFEGRARQISRDLSSLTLQTFLTAQRRLFDAHDVELVAGYEYNDYSTNEFGAEGQGFSTDAFGYYNLGGGNTLVKPFSWAEESKLVSFFSRANWSLADKYFLTGVLRYDGSSRFGEGNKWALFPAISASWRLSEEPFLQGRWFSDLRLRAGYGLQGNPAVPPYASLITLGPGGNYVFGETPVTGIAPTRNANPDLKWEETSQFNIAVDWGFSDNRFNGTIEYYVKNTTDLLLEVPVPQPALVATRLENIGEVKNQGLEISVNAPVLTGPSLNWQAGLVFAAERNEVVDLGGRTSLQSARASGQGQSDTWTQRILPGQPLGTFFGPVFTRVSTETTAAWGPGQQLFRCATASATCIGGETRQPTGADYTVIGDANPDFTLGLNSQLNWGRFDASFLVRGEVGQEVFNNTSLVYATKGAVLQGRNFLKSALDDGVDIDEPAIYSSRWIEDGSFVRLQNLTVGYRFALPGLNLRQDARAYVSFDNLLLLTDYSGYDPEVHTAAEGLAVRGVDYLNYARPRTITTGIRLAF